MDNVWLACAYTGMGDKEQAIACLEQDCENHATVAVSLKSNPLFDLLRSEPRYIDLCVGCTSRRGKSRERNTCRRKALRCCHLKI